MVPSDPIMSINQDLLAATQVDQSPLAGKNALLF